MARIQPARARGVRAKLVYHFARRALVKLSGREPERMLEPLQMFAHSDDPAITQGDRSHRGSAVASSRTQRHATTTAPRARLARGAIEPEGDG